MRKRNVPESVILVVSMLLFSTALNGAVGDQKPGAAVKAAPVKPQYPTYNPGWQYVKFTTATETTSFLNGATQNAPSEFRIASVGTQQGGVIYHVFYRPGLVAKPNPLWKVKRVDTPGQVKQFLDSQTGLSFRVCGASTPNKPLMFFIFYRNTGQPAASWGWKLSETIEDANKFVNHESPYTQPIADVEVATAANKFYIFYKTGAGAPWGWVRRETPESATQILNNGTGGPPHKINVARIGAIADPSYTIFYIFYQNQ